MNRRDVLKQGLAGVGVLGVPLLSSTVSAAQAPADESTIYVDPEHGNDANRGTKDTPVRTLAAAARQVNAGTGTGALTIVLMEGVHSVSETALFKPAARTFTKEAPLTIRAEVLPDDLAWAPKRMPVLVHTMPLLPTWLGRPDPFGGVAYGMQFAVSHARVQGLKILGTPHLEHAAERVIRRVYPIAREDAALDGLEVSQCLFIGDPDALPNHCGVLARGHGVVIDHCVFHRCKITTVFWTGDAKGCAMRHSIASNCFVTGAWICAIGDDFQFTNNVMTDNMSAVLFQGDIKGYRFSDSVFAANTDVFAAGNGPAVNYRPLAPTALPLPASVTVSSTSVQIEMDQAKRDYLHVKAGTQGADLGAGLFRKRA
jgi:hypothetical protein